MGIKRFSLVIAFILAILLAIGGTWYFAKKILTVPAPQNSGPIVVLPAEEASSTQNTTSSRISDEDILARDFTFINPENVSFSIAKLPGVNFRIKKITRAVGDIFNQTGCHGKPGNLFLDYFYYAASSSEGICIDTGGAVGSTTPALIAVDVDVTNNTKEPLSKYFVWLFYTSKIAGADHTETAKFYLPMTTNSVVWPSSEKVMRFGFIVPANQNEFQLTYGYSQVYDINILNEESLSQGEGSFNIDFSKKTIVTTPG